MAQNRCSRTIGIKGVLHLYRYVLDTYRIDSRRIHYFCTEITKLHSLNITELADSICSMYHLRIGRHESIDISPYLQDFGIQCCGDDRSRIVASSSAEISNFSSISVCADESWHNRLLCPVSERFLHGVGGNLAVEHVLAMFLDSLYEVQRVVPLCAIYQRRHDMAAKSLSVTHDCGLDFRTQVVYQIYSIVNGLKFFKQSIYGMEKSALFFFIINYCVNHFIMTLLHEFELRLIRFISTKGQLRSGYEFVSDAAESAYNNDNVIILPLHDFLQAQNTFNRTDRGSAKLQYFHTLISDIYCYAIFLFKTAKVIIIVWVHNISGIKKIIYDYNIPYKSGQIFVQ